MVTLTLCGLTTTTIMCETADQCGRMDLPASHLDRLLLHLCHITLWLLRMTQWVFFAARNCTTTLPHLTSPQHQQRQNIHFAFTRFLFFCVYRTIFTFNTFFYNIYFWNDFLLCDTKICLFNQYFVPNDVFALSLFAMPRLALTAYHIENIIMT